MNKKKSKYFSNKFATCTIIGLIIGFLLFYFAYDGMVSLNGLGSFNLPVLSWFSSHRNPTADAIMQIMTTFANPTFFVIVVSIVAFTWAYKKHEIWRPFIMSIAVIISAITSSLFKVIIQNSRPDNIDMVPPFEAGYSFPSGHTLSTLVFLLISGYLFYSRYRKNDKKYWLIAWIAATILGTGIITLSRLYLGYHWLTDVVASIGLGIIIFIIVVLFDKIHTKNFKRSKIKI